MIPRVRSGRALAVATAALVAAVAVGVSVGPADLPLPAVGEALLTRLPWHPGLSVSAVAVTIVWQVRLPRVVLGALVGAMLAGGGAAYQGVFRNPLADPYLLGVAAGGGLGATMIIISGGSQALLPPGRVRRRQPRGRGHLRAGGDRQEPQRAPAGHRVDRAGRRRGRRAVHRRADLSAARAHAGHPADLRVDPGQPGHRLLVRRGHDPALRRRRRRAAARPPAAARCAPGRRGGSHQPRRGHRAAAAHRGHRGHARHRGGGRGQRADRLRRHHHPAHGAADGRRELPDRAAGLHDRRARPSWCSPTSPPAPSRRLPRCRSA